MKKVSFKNLETRELSVKDMENFKGAIGVMGTAVLYMGAYILYHKIASKSRNN